MNFSHAHRPPAFHDNPHFASYPPAQGPPIGYQGAPGPHYRGPAPGAYPSQPAPGFPGNFAPPSNNLGPGPRQHFPGADMSRYYDDRRREHDRRDDYDRRGGPALYRSSGPPDLYRSGSGPPPPMAHYSGDRYRSNEYPGPSRAPYGPSDRYLSDRPPQARYDDRRPLPRDDDRRMPPRHEERRLLPQQIPRTEERRLSREDERGSPAKRPRLEESRGPPPPVRANSQDRRDRNTSTDSEPPLYDREGGGRLRSPSPHGYRRGRSRSRSPGPPLRRRTRSRSPDDDRGGRYFERRRRSRSRSRSPPRRRRSPSAEFKMPNRSKQQKGAPSSTSTAVDARDKSAQPGAKTKNSLKKFFPGDELDDDDSPNKLTVDHPFLSSDRGSKVRGAASEAIDVDAQPEPRTKSHSRRDSHHSSSGTPRGPAPHQMQIDTPPQRLSTSQRSQRSPVDHHGRSSYPPPQNGRAPSQGVYDRQDHRVGGHHASPQQHNRASTSHEQRHDGPPPRHSRSSQQSGKGSSLPTTSSGPAQMGKTMPTKSPHSMLKSGVPTTDTGSPAVPPPPANGEGENKATAAKDADAEQKAAEEAARPIEYYERVEQVGEGTYGKVYKAKSIEDGTLVALKMIRMDAEKDGFPVTAVREIKLLQSLRHQNVVPLKEMMVSRGQVHMVFEYVDHDLTGVLRHPNIKFSPAHLKSMMAQLLRGLEYIHRRGVLHRDLKGSNILISRAGQLKIADFGLARFFAPDARNDYTNRVITQWYKPPELLFGATIYGACVDVWSAGCIFLELFSGKPAFQGNDEIHQLEVIFRVLGTPDATTWPDVSELPWYELVKPKKTLPNRLREAYAKYIHTPATFSAAEALLTLNPDRRVTASEALALPYFVDEEPKPEDPTFLETVDGDWHEWEAKRRAKRKSTSAAEVEVEA